MDNKEKFQLVIKFLDKQISEKNKNISIFHGGFQLISIDAFENDQKEVFRVIIFDEKDGKKLMFKKYGFGKVIFDVDDAQLTEVKYKANIISSFLEEVAIDYLKSI